MYAERTSEQLCMYEALLSHTRVVKSIIRNCSLHFLLLVNSSDWTDLSTESGSGPIQLARARYRTTRRSVADSLPHCINAPQRTLQAKKRGKISEKWEYTVGMWNDVWLTEHRIQIRASDIEVHNRWLNFHSWTSGPSFIARWSYRITHRVARAVKKASKLKLCSRHSVEAESLSINTCRVAARPSGLGEHDHRHHTWRASVFRPAMDVCTWTSV